MCQRAAQCDAGAAGETRRSPSRSRRKQVPAPGAEKRAAAAEGFHESHEKRQPFHAGAGGPNGS